MKECNIINAIVQTFNLLEYMCIPGYKGGKLRDDEKIDIIYSRAFNGGGKHGIGVR